MSIRANFSSVCPVFTMWFEYPEFLLSLFVALPRHKNYDSFPHTEGNTKDIKTLPTNK
jgi:hypothetical protein